ncbi:MAG: TonB family protein [Opitutaceae bacterium]|nr:TonB family protein [Opitutaceae bacterium]
MHARAPSAFFLSLLFHVAAVMSIVVLAFVVQRRTPPPVQIFELVAGPPTDLTATEAPALGSPDGTVDVKIPEPPARPDAVPAPEPAAVEPAPVVQKPAPVKPAPRTETKTAKAPAQKDTDRISYDQYVKKHGKPAPAKPGSTAAPRSGPVPKINARGIAEGVLGGSANSKGGGGGRALTAAQRSALEGYIARLVTALRQNHEKPPGLSDLLSADVEFLIAADGTISRVQIVRSSGNTDFDLSCLEAFKRMGSVGPKPDGKSDTWVLTFRMKDE